MLGWSFVSIHVESFLALDGILQFHDGHVFVEFPCPPRLYQLVGKLAVWSPVVWDSKGALK